MSTFKFFLCSIFCFCPLFCEAGEWLDNDLPIDVYSEYDVCEYEVVGNKVYIQPEQLSIVHNGIYILIQGEPIFVCQLNCDENGIYCLIEHLDSITGQCKNKHPIWCKRCWGCIVRWCKFRCKCVEWE